MKKLIFLSCLMTSASFATSYNLSEFAVFSKNNIDYSRSDFEGKVGALGSISVRDFSFHKSDTAGVLIGENLTYERGYMGSGPAEVGGQLLLSQVKVESPVKKYALTATEIILNESSVNGSIRSREASVSYRNGAATVSYASYKRLSSSESSLLSQNLRSHLEDTAVALDDLSVKCAELASTSGKVVGDTLILEAISGVNVFSVDATVLNSISKIQFSQSLPFSSFVINIAGSEVMLSQVGISLEGVGPDQIIWNFFEAEKITITRSGSSELYRGRKIGIPGRILAPVADVYFTEAVVTGGLMVGDLHGNEPGKSGGQVNFAPSNGHWCGGSHPRPGKG